MTTQQPPFQCHFPGCDLSYQRKEHLTRHAKRHFQTDRFECSFCDRVFSRNDTLRQHVRTHHKTKELQYSRTIQACTYCRSRRSKCDGRSPCDTCFQRGIQCLYTRILRGRPLEQNRPRNPRKSPIPSVESVDEFYSPPTESAGPIQRSESIENSPCRVAPYVQAYFDKFHPKWPFLHPATFDPDNELPFLAQSVVMMGSWAMMESNAQQTAKDLHKRLTSSIYEQRVSSVLLLSKFPFLLLKSHSGIMGHIESPLRATLAATWNIPIQPPTLADGNIPRNPVAPHLLPPPQPRPARSGIDSSNPRDPLSTSDFPRAHLSEAAHVLLSLNIGPIQTRS